MKKSADTISAEARSAEKGANGALQKRLSGDMSLPDNICRLIAGGGVLMLILTFVTLFKRMGGFLMIFPIPVVSGYLVGFLSQSLALKKLRWTPPDDGSWEGGTRYFVFRYALFGYAAVVLCLILMNVGAGAAEALRGEIPVLLSAPSREYAPRLITLGTLVGSYYTPLFIVSGGIGVYVSFYPYGRLFSLRNFFVYCTAGALAVSFGLVYGSGNSTVLFFCLMVVCGVLILNQTHIIKTYRTAAVTRIDRRARMSNMRITLACLIMTAAAGLLVYMFVSGVYLLGRYIFYTVLLSALRGADSEIRNVYGASGDSGEFIPRMSGSDSANMAFAVAVILIIVIFEIATGNTFLKRLAEALKELVAAVIDFFLGGERFAPETRLSYADTVESVAKESGRKNAFHTVPGAVLTRRAFEQEMRSLPDDVSRLTYVYGVLLGTLREYVPGLKESDTPREIEKKIGEKLGIPEMREITEVIELVKYADRGVPEEVKSALDAASGLVRKRL